MSSTPASGGVSTNGSSSASASLPSDVGKISISALLKRLSTHDAARQVTATEVAAAVALVFSDRLSLVQFALLLWALHTTGLDHQASVLAACAESMRGAAAQADGEALKEVVLRRGRREGDYQGGLCDIVGTGGDGHNTFNISTTSSIIASAQLMIAKHGNNSSTSLSGSADLLQHALTRLVAPNSTPSRPDLAPHLPSVIPSNLSDIYSRTNYAFLYAREWHPGMRFAAAVRKEVPVRTIFNLLGPLANPVHDTGLLEARILGVARKDIGMNFAEALQISGARKALVVCGEENLDELSCAGPTRGWYIHDAQGEKQDSHTTIITELTLTPEDFGLSRHPLSAVHGGKGPAENAALLLKILRNEVPDDDPVLQFVLLNTAALLTVSGICEADTTTDCGPDGQPEQVIQERGPGGLRWKEGVRRARWCIRSGQAWRQWTEFVKVTNTLEGREVIEKYGWRNDPPWWDRIE